jgi:hypothetical protein
MNKTNKATLNELWKSKQHKDNPSFPIKYLTDYKHSDNSTNGLTKCVVDFLNYSGHFAERINNTGRFIAGTRIDEGHAKFQTQGKWIKGTGVNGRADISAKIKLPQHQFAIPVEIEIKYAKDRMSDAQREYQSAMFDVGAVYIVVRDFDMFMDWYVTFTAKK